ncbi:MAG: NAD(P)-dependent oxidoreductase [Pseudomonadales bacterium]|nr:NAD(P)-dependent oxidoreductase [Pseudomonadales bacterium]
MKILITGAFGNIGSMLLDELIARGHEITAFDLQNAANKEVQLRYKNKIKTAWGDICDKNSIKPHIKHQDVVVHFAAIIPPMTETHPQVAESVNIGGTQNLLEMIKDSDANPLLVFTSSFAVWGLSQASPPPRTVNCPLIVTDNYSRHKIECENLIRTQDNPWVILRIGACFDTRNRHIDKQSIRMMLDTRADNRIEYIHPADVATAAANAIERKEAHNKLHLIGGGKSCQITQIQMVNTLLGAAGFTLKEKDFGNNAFYSDWMDTSESQRILEFQNNSFDVLRDDLFTSLKFVRPFVQPLSRFASWGFVKWARS